jgi:hypothetical protein
LASLYNAHRSRNPEGSAPTAFDTLHDRFRSEIRDIDRHHLGFADCDLQSVGPEAYLPRGTRPRPINSLLFCRMFALRGIVGIRFGSVASII